MVTGRASEAAGRAIEGGRGAIIEAAFWRDFPLSATYELRQLAMPWSISLIDYQNVHEFATH